MLTETGGLVSQLLLFLLTGAILHGFWLTFVFVLRHRGEAAYRLLAVALFCISLHLVSYLLFLTGFIRRLPHFLGVTYPVVYLIGPAFYLCIRFAVHPGLRLQRKDLLHLFPFTLIALDSIQVFARSAAVKSAVIEKILRNEIDYTWAQVITGNLMIAFTMIYALAALQEARRAAKTQEGAENRSNARWLEHFCIGFLALLAADLTIKFAFFALDWNGATLEYLLVAMFALALHLLGYHTVARHTRLPSVSVSDGKYKSSPLSKDQLAGIREKLLWLMVEQKPYLDPELKITTLAGYLKIPSAYLSQLLNEDMNTTFYDFINRYRINCVREKLVEEAYAHYSLLAVALDSGFSNKTTFNRAFKKFTGMTPSEFIAANKAE